MGGRGNGTGTDGAPEGGPAPTLTDAAGYKILNMHRMYRAEFINTRRQANDISV